MAHPINRHISVNYRRDVDGGFAGRIHDHLCRKLPHESIFFDIDDIRPRLDFENTIRQAIATAKLVIAVIGPRWVDCRSADSRRRIDQADDYVRLEIESALSINRAVLPVLVDNAELPSAQLLPVSMMALGKRNAVHIRHISFAAGMAGLVTSIKWLLEQREDDSEEDLPRDDVKTKDGAGTGRNTPRPKAHGRADNDSPQWISAQSDLSRHMVSPSWQPLRGRSDRG